MFSSNNNFKESQDGSVQMPYSKVVLDKVVVYLYTGLMDFEDLTLESLLDLMDLLNLMNLTSEFFKVEELTVTK